MAFVVHRVVAMAAKFKTGSALPAAGPGHGSARLGKKQHCYGTPHNCDLFHKIIIQYSALQFKTHAKKPARKLPAGSFGCE
jgi:hypothetical protein